MFQLSPILTILLISLGISACGGDSVLKDSSPEADKGDDATEAVSMSEAAARGKQLYQSAELGCQACHGANGQSTMMSDPIDLLASEYEHPNVSDERYSLADYISTWMPVNDPSMCVGQCAKDIAEYIRYLGLGGSDGPQLGDDPDTVPIDPDSIDVDTATPEELYKLGKQLYGQLNCATCHTANVQTNTFKVLNGRSEDALRNAFANQEQMKVLYNDIRPKQITAFSAYFTQEYQTYLLSQGGNNPDDEQRVAGEALSSLNKLKMLLTGEAVTNEELAKARYEDGTINLDALVDERFDGDRSLLETWFESEGYKHKLIKYFTVALQQDFSINTLGNTNRFWDTNERNIIIKDACGRTATRIVMNNEDFRTIATTTSWEMTTSLMANLLELDHDGSFTEGGIRSFRPLDDIYNEENNRDQDDWRTINIIVDEDAPKLYPAVEVIDNIDYYRSIPNGGSLTLAAPRYGCFNSPAFLYRWPTNPDNQFRLNVNQAMTAWTAKTFSVDDATEVLSTVGLDEVHSQPGSDCRGCHEHMDPMTNVFKNNYSIDKAGREKANYKRGDKDQYLPPAFSFQGHSTPVADMKSFAEALSQHPNVATAWTERTCQWLNSKACDTTDSRFTLAVEAFKKSDYDFETMLKALIRSGLITDVSTTANSELASSTVGINRRTHFCHALEYRSKQILDALGKDSSNYHGLFNRLECFSLSRTEKDSRNYYVAVTTIPDDHMQRGETHLTQATQTDSFIATFYDGACKASAPTIVDNLLMDQEPDQSLDLITQYMLGIPSNADEYETVNGGLKNVYGFATFQDQICSDSGSSIADSLSADGNNRTCGLGLNKRQALEFVWRLACQSPALSGVGI